MKAAGWSTEKMDETASNQLAKNTEEIVSSRSTSEKIHNFWDTLAAKIDEEMLEKQKVKDSKRGAYRGSGEPLQWRLVRRVKKYQPRT